MVIKLTSWQARRPAPLLSLSLFIDTSGAGLRACVRVFSFESYDACKDNYYTAISWDPVTPEIPATSLDSGFRRNDEFRVINSFSDRLLRGKDEHNFPIESKNSRRSTHSHSIVPGGFEVTSYTTRLIPLTSLAIREDTFASRSCGRGEKSAVMKSRVSTDRRATTFS